MTKWKINLNNFILKRSHTDYVKLNTDSAYVQNFYTHSNILMKVRENIRYRFKTDNGNTKYGNQMASKEYIDLSKNGYHVNNLNVLKQKVLSAAKIKLH
jgi:hypothetical protein